MLFCLLGDILQDRPTEYDQLLYDDTQLAQTLGNLSRNFKDAEVGVYTLHTHEHK